MKIKMQVISVQKIWREGMFPSVTGNGRHRTSGEQFITVFSVSDILGADNNFIEVSPWTVSMTRPLMVGTEFTVEIESVNAQQ